MKPTIVLEVPNSECRSLVLGRDYYSSDKWTVYISFQDDVEYIQQFETYLGAKKMFLTMANLSDITKSVCRVLGFIEEK